MRQLEMRFRLVGWQGLVGMAVGAIDMALWDALGRAAGRPVAALLGGELRPLPAYDSCGIIDPSKDAHLLERSVQSGFRAVKIKIGGGDLADDVKIISETRRIIGPDVALMVDYNQSQTVTGAIERIRRLSEPTWPGSKSRSAPMTSTAIDGYAPGWRRSPSRPARTGGSPAAWPTPSPPTQATWPWSTS
jgi:L-alanine-DL-glutamate epimerase-like enolase superfamily enzyme